jgi:fatty-acyl-CoA synthase
MDSTVAIVFTSGATGPSKACGISHRQLFCSVDSFIERFELSNDSRLWLPLPMFQVGFLMAFAASISVSAALIACERFDAVNALSVLIAERITHAFPIYATYWLPILYQPGFRPSELIDLSHAVLLGPMSVLRRVQRAVPQCVLMQIYGSAETAGAICMPRADDPVGVRLGAAGGVFPGQQVRIVDPKTGAVRAPGGIGEIHVRGVGVVTRYVDDPRATARAVLSDGWLRTSDLGCMSPDGVLEYLGRLSDMLTIGGQSVAATSIEASLSAHPSVAMAQVIATPDARLGEVSVAFIEVRPGTLLDSAELIAFCRERMNADHIPRYVNIVVEWPISASKIRKQALARLPLGERLVD